LNYVALFQDGSLLYTTVCLWLVALVISKLVKENELEEIP